MSFSTQVDPTPLRILSCLILQLAVSDSPGCLEMKTTALLHVRLTTVFLSFTTIWQIYNRLLRRANMELCTWCWCTIKAHPKSFFLFADILVQFEEDRWEPGKWQNLSMHDGNLNSVNLQLSPFVNYQFRVIAINAVGQSQPSHPSARYQTSGARELAFILTEHWFWMGRRS